MPSHRGGRKRPWKHKKCDHRKAYQKYCRDQREAGYASTSSGKWVLINALNASEKTKHAARADMAHIGTNQRFTPWRPGKRYQETHQRQE